MSEKPSRSNFFQSSTTKVHNIKQSENINVRKERLFRITTAFDNHSALEPSLKIMKRKTIDSIDLHIGKIYAMKILY